MKFFILCNKKIIPPFLWNADNSDFVFNVLVRDKIELAAFYQPFVCWNSKLTTVVTASVALDGGCHSSFHRGKDWSQGWGSNGPAPPTCPQAPSLSSEPGKATALLQPTAPLSLRLTPETDTHWTQLPCTQQVHKKHPNHKQVLSLTGWHHTDETRLPQVAGQVQPVCAKLFPKSIQCNFVLASRHLQSDRQPKGTGFRKNIWKYWTCYL